MQEGNLHTSLENFYYIKADTILFFFALNSTCQKHTYCIHNPYMCLFVMIYMYIIWCVAWLMPEICFLKNNNFLYYLLAPANMNVIAIKVGKINTGYCRGNTCPAQCYVEFIIYACTYPALMETR